MAKFLRNHWLSVLMGVTIIVLLAIVNHYRQMNSSLLRQREVDQAETNRIHKNWKICEKSLTTLASREDDLRVTITAQEEIIRMISPGSNPKKGGVISPPEVSRRNSSQYGSISDPEDEKLIWGRIEELASRPLQPADRPKQVKGNATVSKLPSFRPTFSTALIDIGVAHRFKGKASSHSMEEGLFSLFTKSA